MDCFRSADFTALAERLIQQHHVPGLAVAVIDNDRLSSLAFGKAQLEPPTPCAPDTLFDIASCSKSFTAAAIGVLVEDREKYPDVEYSSKMANVLPDDFVMPSQEYTDSVTIDDLLGHMTGMGRSVRRVSRDKKLRLTPLSGMICHI
jgi:CubicO group peptidase (beta-lactamase class C family)